MKTYTDAELEEIAKNPEVKKVLDAIVEYATFEGGHMAVLSKQRLELLEFFIAQLKPVSIEIKDEQF